RYDGPRARSPPAQGHLSHHRRRAHGGRLSATLDDRQAGRAGRCPVRAGFAPQPLETNRDRTELFPRHELGATCHLIPISLVPPDPDRSAVSWTEKPHLSPEVAMSRKRTGRRWVAKRSSPPSAAVAPSTRSPRSST